MVSARRTSGLMSAPARLCVCPVRAKGEMMNMTAVKTSTLWRRRKRVMSIGSPLNTVAKSVLTF
jgi:hypothetical protein